MFVPAQSEMNALLYDVTLVFPQDPFLQFKTVQVITKEDFQSIKPEKLTQIKQEVPPPPPPVPQAPAKPGIPILPYVITTLSFLVILVNNSQRTCGTTSSIHCIIFFNAVVLFQQQSRRLRINRTWRSPFQPRCPRRHQMSCRVRQRRRAGKIRSSFRASTPSSRRAVLPKTRR